MNSIFGHQRCFTATILLVLLCVVTCGISCDKGDATDKTGTENVQVGNEPISSDTLATGENPDQSDQSPPIGHWPGHGPYIYPDMKEFGNKNMTTRDWLLATIPAIQVPNEVLKKMTTDELIKTYLNLPMSDYVFYSRHTFIKKDENAWFQQNFNVYKELISRTDAGRRVIEYFVKLPVDHNENDPLFDGVTDDPLGINNFDNHRKTVFHYLALLLSDEVILSQFDRQEKMALLVAVLKKQKSMKDSRWPIFVQKTLLYLLGNTLKALEYKPFYHILADDGRLGLFMSGDIYMFVGKQIEETIIRFSERASANVESEYGLSDLEKSTLIASIKSMVSAKSVDGSSDYDTPSPQGKYKVPDQGSRAMPVGYWPGHGPYIFPNSNSFSKYRLTRQERMTALQVPIDILPKLTTDDLIKSFINGPLTTSCIYSSDSSVKYKIKWLRQNFNVYKELISRADAGQTVLNFFNKLPVYPDKNDVIFNGVYRDPYGDGNIGGQRKYIFRCFVMLLSDNSINSQFSYNDNIQLLVDIIIKYQKMEKLGWQNYQKLMIYLLGHTLKFIEHKPLLDRMSNDENFRGFINGDLQTIDQSDYDAILKMSQHVVNQGNVEGEVK